MQKSNQKSSRTVYCTTIVVKCCRKNLRNIIAEHWEPLRTTGPEKSSSPSLLFIVYVLMLYIDKVNKSLAIFFIFSFILIVYLWIIFNFIQESLTGLVYTPIYLNLLNYKLQPL